MRNSAPLAQTLKSLQPHLGQNKAQWRWTVRMKTTCGKKTTRESSFQEPLFSDHEKTSGSTHSPASAKRKLRFKKKRAAGHSIDCDFVPQGRASRSEKRTVGPVTSKPTEHHHTGRHQLPGHAPHRAYFGNSSRLTKRLSSTMKISRFARLTNHVKRRPTQTRLDLFVRLLDYGDDVRKMQFRGCGLLQVRRTSAIKHMADGRCFGGKTM